MKKSLLALAALAAATGTALSSAQAATVVALADGNTMHWIDTATKKVTGTVKLADGGTIVGFDVRPSNKTLYGLTADGAIVTIDAKSGKWEKKAQLSEKLPQGVGIAVDFNPAADRMRIIAEDGTSLRVNVEDGKAAIDGKIKYAETDPAKGATAKVGAVAYTNSFAGTTATVLYDIDLTAGTFLRQAPPNDGIVNTVGKLGVAINGPVALDIESDGKGGNTAWVMMGGELFSLDIATGAVKSEGKIAGLTGKVTDIAVMPAN